MSIDNLTGQTFGQYQLRELIGVGGMGTVYKGYQPSLRRYVAVKVLAAQLSQQAHASERFTREAETSAALEHPNIIRVYDYGTQRGISFLVMQLLTGGTLAERIAQQAGQQPAPGEVAALLKQVASALDYAHSQGVIHRDIKPSNIMFDNQGTAYLVDFGIARLAEATHALTAPGLVIGTWGYMAPEQWRAEDPTPATDQYALGVITYTLITGQMPFEAPTPAGVMHKHLNEMPVPPHLHRSAVPEAVTLVLERALAKQAAQRFPTCTAFAQAFSRAIQGQAGSATGYFSLPVQHLPPPSAVFPAPDPVHPTPPPAVFPAPAPAHSHTRRSAWAALALIAGLVLTGIVLLITSQRDQAQEQPTRTAQPTATRSAAIVILSTPQITPPGQTSTAAPPATLPLAPDATPTRSETDTAETLAAEMALLQTGQAPTIQAAQTATAEHWTITPDLRATAAALLTQTQNAALTQAAHDLTAIPTETPTSAPSPTATPSLSPTAAAPTPTWTFLIGSVNGLDMVYVPAGCFMMGSTAEQIETAFQQCERLSGTGKCERTWFEAEGPAHQVCLDAFWIGRTEVTNRQYGAAGYFAGDNRPRDAVNWYEARDFCASRGARLPSEAEWEYAARGPEGRLYPWGSTFVADNLVWYQNSGGASQDVGSQPGGISWVGALDLSGNVWEWVSSLYRPYPYDAGQEDDGSASGDRVIRGGAWYNLENDQRAATRGWFPPGDRDINLGFRCVVSAS